MAISGNFLVEFLPRIGTTSVVLENFEEPSLKYSDSGILTVQDGEDEQIEITLPYHPGVIKFKRLVKVKESDKEYLLTLKSENFQLDKYHNDILSIPHMKWNKSQLSDLEDFRLCCIQCGVSIIDHHNCLRLNEMPSEFWMELMDYWHCHKPQDKKSDFYSLQKNSIRPCLNEILIGECFFQAIEETFEGRIAILEENDIACSNCNGLLGRKTSDKMFRIYKWKLQLTGDNTESDLFPAEYEVISALLNRNRANSTRYVLLECGTIRLFIWLFAFGIDITLSNGQILHNCVKIFYSNEMPSNIGFKTNVDEEKVDKIPLEKFIEKLECINCFLPSSKRSFKSWKISYLPVAME